MDQFDNLPGQRQTGFIVIGLVVAGLGLVGLGGYLVYSKNRSAGQQDTVSDNEVGRWCQVRKEWARKVEPLVGDILLKSVREQDREALQGLVLRRNTLCHDYARKVAQLKVTHPALQRAEVALVVEGKTRANVAVEIDNLLAKVDAPDTSTLRANRDKLNRYIKQRIDNGRAKAQSDVRKALATAGGPCSGIFHGTVTDEGTSGNPYVSWEELELRRTQALRKYDKKIKEMEPVEQFANRVFHQLVAHHRKTLTRCYRSARAKNPEMSDQMGLRIRLKPDGKVATLAIEWMNNREEKILDCLLNTASKWKLPRPDPTTNVVVVSLDFTTL